MRYQGRLCVSDVDWLRVRILTNAHESRYTVHPSLTKMYHDLKEIYWWNNMKRDMLNFMAKCMVCYQVKVEHLRPVSRDGVFFMKVGGDQYGLHYEPSTISQSV